MHFISAYDFFQPSIAERVSGGILWFNHAICVEQEAVSGSNLNFANRVFDLGQNSDQDAIALVMRSNAPLRQRRSGGCPADE